MDRICSLADQHVRVPETIVATRVDPPVLLDAVRDAVCNAADLEDLDEPIATTDTLKTVQWTVLQTLASELPAFAHDDLHELQVHLVGEGVDRPGDDDAHELPAPAAAVIATTVEQALQALAAWTDPNNQPATPA